MKIVIVIIRENLSHHQPFFLKLEQVKTIDLFSRKQQNRSLTFFNLYPEIYIKIVFYLHFEYTHDVNPQESYQYCVFIVFRELTPESGNH